MQTITCQVSLDFNTVRNSNNSTLGYINADGTGNNSNNSLLGRVNDDGTVRGPNNHLPGLCQRVFL